MFAKIHLGGLTAATILALFAPNRACANSQLTISARDDMPAGPNGVRIQVVAKDAGGATLLTTDLFWNGDDNSFSTKSVQVPLDTRILRFTFLDDCCGSNGPGDCGASCQVVCDAVGNPDCDRNAYIDSFTLFSNSREAESFDSGTCSAGSIDGRTVAICGQEGAFVEYNLPANCDALCKDQSTSKVSTADEAACLSECESFCGGSDQILYCSFQNKIIDEVDACCLPDDSCTQSFTREQCAAAGGTFYAAPATCADIAAKGGCAADIPAVSEWGLIVLGLLVLAAGSIAVMRRQPTPA